MLLMPAIGKYADQHGNKKRLLALTTLGCVLATVGLAWAGRGDVALAVALVLLSNLFYSFGDSLNSAFLPELAREKAMGRVSGWGWSFGYIGGMLSLGLSLAWVLAAQKRGEPATSFVPVTLLITAAVYSLASLATFALLRERAVKVAPGSRAADGETASLANLAATWREARRFPDFVWLLVCTTGYQAGISVVIALAAVYAEQVLGFRQIDSMMLIFLVNIAAALGAFGFGYWQDRVGHKRALTAALVGWCVATVMAVMSTGPGLFWCAAVLAGVCMGASQSAGRTLVGLFAPRGRRAEFFGLWTFATRLSAIVGPVTYGVVNLLSGGNHRVALVSTLVFFVVGLVTLGPVNLARGRVASAN
jgi:UMF1 family MFS transporter